MELIALPSFYHSLIFFFFVILVLIIAGVFVFLARKKRKKVDRVDFDDIYSLSIELQKIDPNDKEIKEFLQKIEKFKYRKNSSPLPKKFKEEAKRLYRKKISGN